MEEREEELKKLFRDELESVRNSQKTLFTENISKLEKKFQNHQQEFMMIQQMNDANSMQHEEARRQVENIFLFLLLDKKSNVLMNELVKLIKN